MIKFTGTSIISETDHFAHWLFFMGCLSIDSVVQSRAWFLSHIFRGSNFLLSITDDFIASNALDFGTC